ncbi:mitochondrial 2-methylisocitrate lyase [Marasmius tenuissimus]|nr:mitochondrial 2-methylisocitrate lyase [Marasmius tenuissimus]
MNDFFSQPRFKSTKRTYTASDVASKQGSLPVLPPTSNLPADKLHAILSKAAEAGKPVLTMGAIDPVQMTQMARHQEVVYVSGWACSSVLTTGNNEVGPDFGDYPYTTVPNQVHRIFRAQQLHDKKHYDERVSATPEQREKMEYVDYLRPIIADADTGHGGLSAVMKLTKLFAESGASGIHFEDQLHGGKKQAKSSSPPPPTPPASSPPASNSTSSNPPCSSSPEPTPNPANSSLRPSTSPITSLSRGRRYRGNRWQSLLRRRRGGGAEGKEIDRIEREWGEVHRLVTFGEAVEAAIKDSTIEDKEGAFKTFKDATVGKSISDMREIAKDILGASVFWDYEMPRTREGYYHVTGGLGPAIKRATTFAPYADLVWLETKTPDIEEARYFARKIRETHPETRFVYNLSPSFNWSAHGFSETDLKNFCWELGKEGFVLQLISLAGLHSNATATAELAARYKEDGMLAYVQLVQRKEKEIGCDVLTHQKWSGANYIDKILQSVSSGSSSTSAVGKDSTENSF